MEIVAGLLALLILVLGPLLIFAGFIGVICAFAWGVEQLATDCSVSPTTPSIVPLAALLASLPGSAVHSFSTSTWLRGSSPLSC